jgi:hypothetical protein
MPDETIESGLELLRSGRCKSVVEAARNAGCARATLQEHWLKEKRGEPMASKEITVEGDLPSSWTPDKLLREHGLDPEEWVIARIRVNRWDDPDNPKQQLRFDVVPKAAVVELVAPDPSKWKSPPKPRKPKATKPLRAVVISDHHAPHHERTFHKLFLRYLADEQPEIIDVNGDLLDFSTISRHREIEAYANPVNECLQAGFEILADYRSVCPNATIRYKRGNHSERLRAYLMDNARALHGITAANEELPALSLQRLLRLEELHVEYIDTEWEQAKTKLSPKLTVRHGFSTAKNAGETMLDRLSGSTVQGHDHRAGMTFRTEHTGEVDEPLRTRLAMQTGCACEIPGGLGYSVDPNWLNAFGAFEIYPDGDFHASLGVYVPGRLLAPNSKRYSP